MKRLLALLITVFISTSFVLASTDKYSKEYLQGKKHFSLSRCLAESIARRGIKSALKKETGAKFDVKFEGYTASSIKKGVFKNIELTGENINSDGIIIPYVHLKSLTDYNYIDYNQNPMKFKSDMTFAYDVLLTDETINQALEKSDYNKTLSKVNRIAGSLFVIKKVRTKIVNNKLYIVIDYNFPIVKSSKDKSLVTSSDFKVVNGKIKAKNVHLDSVYGNLGLDKVANLINLLNPLEFTLDMLDENKYKGNIENVNIVDNNIKVDGKIYLKGEG